MSEELSVSVSVPKARLQQLITQYNEVKAKYDALRSMIKSVVSADRDRLQLLMALPMMSETEISQFLASDPALASVLEEIKSILDNG